MTRQIQVCPQKWALGRDLQGAHQHAALSINQLSTDVCFISIAESRK